MRWSVGEPGNTVERGVGIGELASEERHVSVAACAPERVHPVLGSDQHGPDVLLAAPDGDEREVDIGPRIEPDSMSSAKESCTSIVAWRWGPSSRPGPTGTTDISMASVRRLQVLLREGDHQEPGLGRGEGVLHGGPIAVADDGSASTARRNATVTEDEVARSRRTPAHTPRQGTRQGPSARRFFRKLKSWAFAASQNSVGLELVLDAEDRLAGVDERIEAPALAVLVALLVERRVEVRQQRADLAEVVLQQRATGRDGAPRSRATRCNGAGRPR